MRDSQDGQLVGFAMKEGGGAEPADDIPLPDADPEDFAADDYAENIDRVVKLSDREQCARNLAIRRAIERRMERKALEHDLNCLDCDLDD